MLLYVFLMNHLGIHQVGVEFRSSWWWIVIQPLCWVWISLAKYSQNLSYGFQLCGSTWQRFLKITNIFLYAPYMHWNNSAYLFWGNIMCDSCYAVTVSESCWYLLLYPNSMSVFKLSSWRLQMRVFPPCHWVFWMGKRKKEFKKGKIVARLWHWCISLPPSTAAYIWIIWSLILSNTLLELVAAPLP